MMVVLARCFDDYQTWQQGLEAFPEAVRNHFRYFIIARMIGKMSAEAIACVPVCLLVFAADAQKHKESVKLVKQAWLTIFMGPVMVWIVVPFGASIRTDLVQRDVCGTTLSGMMSNELYREYFYKMAVTDDEQLARIAKQPPMQVGKPGWESWGGTTWCYRHLTTWEENIFGTDWVQNAYRIGDAGEPIKRGMFVRFTSRKEGVIPPTINAMATACGLGFDPTMSYCHRSSSNKTSSGHEVAYASRQVKKVGLLDINESYSEVSHNKALASGIANTGTLHDGLYKHHASRGGKTLGQWHLKVGSSMTGSARRLMRTEGSLLDVESGPSPSEARKTSEAQKKALAPPEGFCKSSICALYMSSINTARAARATGQMVIQGVGVYCAMICFASLFMSTFSVVDGCIAGCVGTKKILPRSSLPGYLVGYAVMASLPFILFVLAFINQLVAHPIMALSVTFLAFGKMLNLQKADIMRDTRHPHRMLKEFGKCENRQKMCTVAAGIFAVAYVIRMLFLARNGNVQYLNIPGMGLEAKPDIKAWLGDPLALMRAALQFLFVKTLTKLCSVEAMMEAIFEATGDTLRSKGEADADGSLIHIIPAWLKLRGESAKSLMDGLNSEIGDHWRFDPKSLQSVTRSDLRTFYGKEMNQKQLNDYWHKKCISDGRCKAEPKGKVQIKQAEAAREAARKGPGAASKVGNAVAGAAVATGAMAAKGASRAIDFTGTVAARANQTFKYSKSKMPRQMQKSANKGADDTLKDDLSDDSDEDAAAGARADAELDDSTGAKDDTGSYLDPASSEKEGKKKGMFGGLFG